MGKRVSLIVFALILTICCSCGSKEKTSLEDKGSTTASTTSLLTWSNETEFRYTSIDELVLNAKEKGTELFCKCAEYEGLPNVVTGHFVEYRHEGTEKLLNDALYEVYYKGEKAELYEPVGFNVYFDSRQYGGFAANSQCEYFAKYNDEQYGDCVTLFTFYSTSPLGWDEDYSPQYTRISIKLHGKETECFVEGEVDSETGKWLSNDKKIYLKLDNDAVVVVDLVFSDRFKYYVQNVDWEGYSPYEKEQRLSKDLILNFVPVFNIQEIQSFLNLLEFKKVDVSTVQ